MIINLIIDIISNSTIKLILSNVDMAEYNISYEKLDRKNPDTKRILLDLLDIIKYKENINLKYEKLYIEAFPQHNGGCLIYISVADENVVLKKINAESQCKIVYEFDDINSIIMLYSNIKKSKTLQHKLDSAKIFFNDSCYRMILDSKQLVSNRNLALLLNEYSTPLHSSDISIAATEEHFERWQGTDE